MKAILLRRTGGPSVLEYVELPTPRRQLVHKPVIAAVNGVVAGFSLDLVTEADIPIASDKAYFVDPHVSIGYVSSHERERRRDRERCRQREQHQDHSRNSNAEISHRP